MPRPRSIPNEVINDMLDHYLHGKSPQWIADWTLETNPLRKVPIQTSRASVDRVLEGIMGEHSDYPLIGTILKLQRNAPRYLQQLEEVDAECERLLEELVPLQTVEEQRKAQLLLTSRLKVLAMRERILVRKLRLAGVGGAGGLAAIKAHESHLAKCNEHRRDDPVRNWADWNYQDEPPAGAEERQPSPPDTTGEPARNDPSNRPDAPVHEGMNRAAVSRGAPGREDPRRRSPAAPVSVPSATPARNDPSNRPETPVHEGMKRPEPSREPPESPARPDTQPPHPAPQPPDQPQETRPSWMVRGWGTGK